jgi:hypothetical protein
MNLSVQSQNLISILSFRKRFYADCMKVFGSAVLITGMCHSAIAATLYVNPGGTSEKE